MLDPYHAKSLTIGLLIKQMTERQALAALYSYIYFGPARTRLLVDYFGNAQKAWQSSEIKLLETGLKKERAKEFIKYRDNFNSRQYFRKLKKFHIGFTTINDLSYPKNLRDLDNAPLVLYTRGKLTELSESAVAIVGTRKMTSYGREVTEQFAYELASMGITIVSGLAQGIDTVAHNGALNAKGKTIAVLACGLDQVYPPGNTFLAKKIVEKGGAVLSEYPLGYPAMRENFASRNRIISGLSKAVLVVEGAQRSGTLLTASAAAEQGRPVFAVPGQVTSPMSAASHFLIRNGANIAFSTRDILSELNIQFRVDKKAIEQVMPAGKKEKKLAEILETEPLHLDELAAISGFEVADVSARLTIMELKGLVKNLGGGMFKKT